MTPPSRRALGVYELDRPVTPGEYTVGIAENAPGKRGLGLFITVSDSGTNIFDFELSD